MITTALLLATLVGATDQTFRLEISECPEAGLDPVALERALAIELLPRRLTRSSTVTAAPIGLAAFPCRPYGAVYYLTYASVREPLGDLDDLPPERRATALALLIPERLRARPLLEPRVVVSAPEPRIDRAVHAAATLRTSRAGTLLYGAKIGGDLRPFVEWLAIGLDLGVRLGRSSDPLGTVSTQVYASSLGARFEKDGEFGFGIGPRLELGLVAISGSANAGAASGGGSAPLFTTLIEASVRRSLDEDVSLELGIEAGWVISGLTARADDRELGGLDGYVLGASLGVRLR